MEPRNNTKQALWSMGALLFGDDRRCTFFIQGCLRQNYIEALILAVPAEHYAKFTLWSLEKKKHREKIYWAAINFQQETLQTLATDVPHLKKHGYYIAFLLIKSYSQCPRDDFPQKHGQVAFPNYRSKLTWLRKGGQRRHQTLLRHSPETSAWFRLGNRTPEHTLPMAFS